MGERADRAPKGRRRRLRAALLTVLLVAAAAWLAGGLAAVAGWPLWARWIAAALVWPLAPGALLILVSARLGHRRVSRTIAIGGAVVVGIVWRPALLEAVTTHAAWMIPSDGGDLPAEPAEPAGPTGPTGPPEPPGPPGPTGPQAGTSERPSALGPSLREVKPSSVTEVRPPVAPVTPPPVEVAARRCFREVVETPHSDSAYGTTLADMDGDGRVDAVWIRAVHSHALTVWRGDGRGHFEFASALDDDGGGLSLAVADYDRDGILDVATADHGKATVTLWIGAGDGSLRRGDSFKTYRQPLAVTTADLDADGYSDLIVSHYFHVEVMFGAAKGKLRTAPWLRLVKDPDDPGRLLTPEGIAAADLTGDGLLDLVIPKGDVRSVEVWTGRGRGRFRRSADVESCVRPTGALVGDFDEDGSPDVLIGCGARLELMVGDGAGGLERRGEVGPDHAYHRAGVADINGDAHLDLVVPTIVGGIGALGARGIHGDAKGGRLVILHGDGAGNFTEVDAIDLAGYQHRIVAITDIDGDHRRDVVYECFGQSPGSHLGVVFGAGCG